MTRLRVGILFGGRSAEHEVSLLSARNVVAALDRERFEPVLVGIDRDGRWLLQDEARLLASGRDPRLVRLDAAGASVELPARPAGGALVRGGGGPGPALDVVFPVLHGTYGEDGTVQGLLELAGIPYVGAGVLGSAAGMDKDVMKRLLVQAEIEVADWRTLRRAEFLRDPEAACARALEVGLPLYTKPANLGSSVGIRRVTEAAAVRDAIAHAFEFDVKVVVEAEVRGRELECAVLGNDDPVSSIPGEVVVDHVDGFYSYDAKYVDEHGARLLIPAPLEPAEAEAVQALAVRVFVALECSGMGRVDVFLRPDGGFVANEINTIPGFTAISMYPKLWEASGIGQTELTSRLIELALERHAARAACRVEKAW